jgi:ATP-dependent Lon protease
MGGELERQVLASGIHLTDAGNTMQQFPDYLSEVQDFLDSSTDTRRLPFVNQKTTFMNLIRSLSSGYPYAVLIGESGIGKSMILEYAVNVLTEKVSLSKVEETIPEAVPLLTDTINKLEQFEHRDYLLLPNLKTPSDVTTIAYTDFDVANQDIRVAASFCSELGSFLTDYPAENRDDIYQEMTSQEFKQMIDTDVYNLYIELYTTLEHTINQKLSSHETQDVAALYHAIPLPHFQLPEEKNSPYLESQCLFSDSKHPFNHNVLKEEAGFLPSRKNLTKEDIEQGLGHAIIPELTSPNYKRLRHEVNHTILSDASEENKERLFKEAFAETSAILSESIQTLAEDNDITYTDVQEFLRRKRKPFYRPSNVSKHTIEHINEKMTEIYEDHKTEDCSQELQKWMHDVHSYLVEENGIVQDTLNEIHEQIRDAEERHYNKQSRLRQKKEPQKKQESETAQTDKSQQTLEEELDKIGFPIMHGKYDYDAMEIFTFNYLTDNKALDTGISWTKINTVESEAIFGTFKEISEETPPHHALQSLGSFFQSGILLFKDSFSDFISTITSKKEAGLREQFLEYLQTGHMTLINEGCTYELEAPKIILGCDNQDPFVTVLGGMFARDETGLRGRIKSIQTPAIAKNTPESRQGTMQVIYDTIDTFNTRSDKSQQVTITPEATSMLLQLSTLSEELIGLKYRDLTKSIEDICAYTLSKGYETIDPPLLRDKTKDEIPPHFFMNIDKEKTFGGYFSLPQKQVGHIHGLAVSEGGNGSLIKIRTGYLPPLQQKDAATEHFNLIDIESNLTDETTVKGYDLAKHFTRSLLSEIISKKGISRKALQGDWALNTHFSDSWSGIGGPSASMAIAVSMVSALADEEIYRNRFITGTIDPISGQAGQIGGAYFKALVPMHLKDIENENMADTSDENKYFLFPAQNYKDFTQNLVFDPFGLEERVACIPYTTFAQAYYLLTENTSLTKDDITRSNERGQQKLYDSVLPQIKNRFK